MATQANLDLAQTLYIAYYGRPADRSGLNFWAEKIEADGVESVLADFGTSAEFDARFGDLTNEQLVNNLYNQLFGRDAELEGLEFWAGKLQSGELNLAEIAYEIANGAQDGEGGAPDAATLAAKLAAANAFTAAIDTTEEVVGYQGDAAADAGREFLAGVEAGDEVSEAEAQAAVDAVLGANNPGNTFTLTTGIDNFSIDNENATAGNDTYKAVFSAAGTATGADGTSLNTADIIDGGAGTDTISYLVIGDADGKGAANSVTPANLSNVEEFVVRNLATDSTPANSEEVHTLNLASVSGVTGVTNKGSSAGVTFQNIGKSASVTVDGVTAGNTTFTRGSTAITDAITVNIANGVKAGDILSEDTNNDATEVTINSTGAKNTVGAVNVTGTSTFPVTHTATTVNINAETDLTVGAAGGSADLTGFDTAKSGTINVSGAGKVALNELAGVVKTLNAAENTGGISATGTTAALQEVTGGAGNDSITLAGALADKGFVKLGEGNDKLDIATNAVQAGATIELGAGNDSLVGTGAVSKDAVVDAGAGTDTLAAGLVNAVNVGAFRNFEQLDLVGLGNKTLDADLFAANNSLEALILSGDSGYAAATVSNVAADVGLTITASDTSGVVINQKGTNATASADDQFTVTFDAPAADPVVAKTVTANSLTLNKIDTINVVSDGGEKVSNALTTIVSDEMETLKITGDNDLSLTNLYSTGTTATTTLKTIDASGMTGGLTLDSSAVNGAVTIRLGSGDDDVTVAGLAAPSSTEASMDSIVNFDKATEAELAAGEGYDVISFASVAVNADVAGTTTSVGIKDGVVDFSTLTSGPSNLAEAITAVDGVVGGSATGYANDAAVFEYGSDSYLFVEGGANTDVDVIVKLTGVTGINELGEVGTSDDLYIA